MIRSLQELNDRPVRGEDEEIGQVDGFYFDDYSWAVRYIVIQTGEWLNQRRVIVSVHSLEQPGDEAQSLKIKLTRQIMRNSPDIDLHKPVSRQQEIDLHEYYRWPFYWASSGAATGMGPGNLASVPMMEMAQDLARDEQETGTNPNLRSFQEVHGYGIQARDGAIGEVEDFLIEDKAWNILYMVVDTGSWLPGRKVLVSPQWVQQVEWSQRRVDVDLSRETIKKSPEYVPEMTPSREYEEKLYKHYGKERYW